MIWEELANFESFELVKKFYQERHGRVPGSRHAREIASPLSHARSYFRAAAGADLTIKPLLLYYGVVSLSRTVTLALVRGKREATLYPGHGLTTVDWNAAMSGENPDFTALTVEVGSSGTFTELAHGTGYRSLLRVDSSGVNWTLPTPQISKGSRLSLGDLLCRLPSVHTHHMAWRGFLDCSPCRIFRKADHLVCIELTPRGDDLCSQRTASSIFEGTGFSLNPAVSTPNSFVGPDELSSGPGFTDDCRHAAFKIGSLWVTKPFPGNQRLSKISALFTLAYILGMVVRYYPTQWTALVKGQIDDGALPTISSAIDLIEEEFPRAVLDFLKEKPTIVQPVERAAE